MCDGYRTLWKGVIHTFAKLDGREVEARGEYLGKERYKGPCRNGSAAAPNRGTPRPPRGDTYGAVARCYIYRQLVSLSSSHNLTNAKWRPQKLHSSPPAQQVWARK